LALEVRELVVARLAAGGAVAGGPTDEGEEELVIEA
jgi:hypothetical protein